MVSDLRSVFEEAVRAVHKRKAAQEASAREHMAQLAQGMEAPANAAQPAQASSSEPPEPPPGESRGIDTAAGAKVAEQAVTIATLTAERDRARKYRDATDKLWREACADLDHADRIHRLDQRLLQRADDRFAELTRLASNAEGAITRFLEGVEEPDFDRAPSLYSRWYALRLSADSLRLALGKPAVNDE